MSTKPANCAVCGSKSFTLSEGFFFCDLCGSQVQDLRETEDDPLQTTMAFGQRLKRSERIKEKFKDKDENEVMVDDVKSVSDTNNDPYMCERGLPNLDFQSYFGAIGYRLSTFTKLVAKISHILADEYGVSERIVDYSQWLLQTYLQKFGAAFLEKELAQNGDDLFKPLVKKTASEINKLKLEKRKEHKEYNRRQRFRHLTRTSLLETLSGIDMNMEEHIEEEESEKSGDGTENEMNESEFDISLVAFNRIETALSVEAVQMAAVAYLGIDLILCIVYLSALMAGCKWILLSDIFRWYREGRFTVSITQLSALAFSLFLIKENEMTATVLRKRNYSMFHYGIQPSSESLRVLAYLTQFTAIPNSIQTLKFEKVLSRLVYNINLPKQFLRQINYLYSHLEPVNVDHGSEYFENVLPIFPSFIEKLKKRNIRLGFTSFFFRVFKEDKDDKLERRLLVSAEVKAAALLLFALKLFFGLDDRREYRMRPLIENPMNNGLYSFDFSRWITQLRLRTNVWQGKPLNVVLSKNYSSGETFAGSVRPVERSTSGRSTGQIKTAYRHDLFPGCVPNILRNRVQKGLFDGLFPEGCTRQANGSNSNVALFAPLSYQAKCNSKQLRTEQPDVDETNSDAFFANFYEDYHLELECIEENLRNQFAECARITLPLPANGFSYKRFAELFPCSTNYLRLPPQNFRCVVLRSDSRKIASSLTCPAEPILSELDLELIFTSVQPHLSSTFRNLLRHLALITSETEYLLYFVFLQVEAMFFDQLSIAQAERDLRQEHSVIFTLRQKLIRSAKTREYKHTLRIVRSTKDGPRHKFKYFLSKAVMKTKSVDAFHADEAEESVVAETVEEQGEGIVQNGLSESDDESTLSSGSSSEYSEKEGDDRYVRTDDADSDDIGSESGNNDAISDDDSDDSFSEPNDNRQQARRMHMMAIPHTMAMCLTSFRYW